MNKVEAAKLAEATWHWLAYKQMAGFERLLTEAALVTPIAEYIFGHGGKLEPEGDYGLKFRGVAKAHIYYDLVGCLKEQNFVLEAKFFKNSGHARLFVDLVRLALPTEKDWNRYLLVVWAAKKFDPNTTRQFLELNEHELLKFEISNKELVVAGKRVNMGTESRRQIAGLSDIGSAPSMFATTCQAKYPKHMQERRLYNVAIYSVERLDTTAAIKGEHA